MTKRENILSIIRKLGAIGVFVFFILGGVGSIVLNHFLGYSFRITCGIFLAMAFGCMFLEAEIGAIFRKRKV